MERDGLEALYAAQDSLKIRQSSLQTLTDYLPVAEEQERAQAEQDRRQALEQERDAAIEEHNRLDEVFESDMQPLEAIILDYLDRLDQTAMQRGRAESRRADAAFELAGRQADWSRRGELSDGHGWYSLNTPGARSNVRQALFELFAVRRRLHGLLQLDGQDSGYRPVVSRSPQIDEPDDNEAFRAQVSAEFAAKRLANAK